VNKKKGASEKFKEISEAYKMLSDSKRRKEYDQNWASRATTSATGDGGMGSGARQTDFGERQYRWTSGKTTVNVNVNSYTIQWKLG
jgi:DnaJ-class molecular chaperone